MDVDAFLNIERRTGIKDDDIKGFLSKVDNVQDQLSKLMSGELKPEDVKIPGERTAEEELIFQKDKARRARERAEEKAKEIKDEHDKWWRGAEMRKEHMVEQSQQKVTVEIEGQIFPKPKVEGKDCLDYSKWDTWVPDDPVSLAEMKEKVDKVDAEKNKIFEQNNPDFCNNFKEDMEKREQTKLRKQTDAERARQKGNKHFKRKEYKTALKYYKEALNLTPYANISILTNIAQVKIKLDMYVDAIEFCNRALFMSEENIKALSRRALCYKKLYQYENALKDLTLANTIDPGNKAVMKQLKRCTMEKEEKDAEDKVLKMVGAGDGAGAGGGVAKEEEKTETSGAGGVVKEEKKSSLDQRVEMLLHGESAAAGDPGATPVVSPEAAPKAPVAVTAAEAPAAPKTSSTTTNSQKKMQLPMTEVPVTFTMMDDAHNMFKKWWLQETKEATTEATKEVEKNACLAASAVFPLLVVDDAMRIYFRRCGMLQTFSNCLEQWSMQNQQEQNLTAVMEAEATKVEEGTADAAATAESTEAEYPKVSTDMLISLLTTLSAACRNRLVQRDFVTDCSGLSHITTVLSHYLNISTTAATTGGTAQIVNISVVRSCVELTEACTSHDTSISLILKYMKKVSKIMQHNLTSKKKKNKKKVPSLTKYDALPLACRLPVLLLEVINIVQSNMSIVQHAVDSLCVLSGSITKDEVVPYMSLLSSRQLNVVQCLSSVLKRTEGKDDTTHPSCGPCREACARCMVSLSMHAQWRAFFCAYDAVPSLVGVLKPNTLDTTAARANALAALMNGACASEDTAAEVYTEVRDQIHKVGAVAWLVHWMEPKETFTKINVGSTSTTTTTKEKSPAMESFESTYSKSASLKTTQSQRAALVLQKRSKKTLDDHVRERSAGLLSRCATHPPVKAILSHPNLYERK
jgi:tetratricopeptide (TPR) repeat protein